ncbi:TonB-dependent receptor [Pleurocapsales cyanobacterium LEGE 10410]|nr:TonB-dependent receptor [Pleurocapsales cyanobacterium LEGE 10410]
MAAETTESFVDFFERDRYLVNPVLSWQIGDNTNLTFDFEYRHIQYLPEFGLPAVGTVLDNPNGDIPEERFIGDVDVSGDRDTNSYRLGYDLEHQFSENWKLRNAFSALWRKEDSIAITPSNLDADGRTLSRGYFDTGEGFKTNTYTLDTYTVGNFNTSSIKHELVTGIELARAETINDESFGGDVSPIDLFDPQYGVASLSEPTFFVDTKNTQDSLGIYLQDRVVIYKLALLPCFFYFKQNSQF